MSLDLQKELKSWKFDKIVPTSEQAYYCGAIDLLNYVSDVKGRVSIEDAQLILLQLKDFANKPENRDFCLGKIVKDGV